VRLLAEPARFVRDLRSSRAPHPAEREVAAKKSSRSRSQFTVASGPKSYMFTVEPMKHYSKPVYQGRRLRRMVELVENQRKCRSERYLPRLKYNEWTAGCPPGRSLNWCRRIEMVSQHQNCGDSTNSVRAASSRSCIAVVW
jgi:hypothetical protein